MDSLAHFGFCRNYVLPLKNSRKLTDTNVEEIEKEPKMKKINKFN